MIVRGTCGNDGAEVSHVRCSLELGAACGGLRYSAHDTQRSQESAAARVECCGGIFDTLCIPTRAMAPLLRYPPFRTCLWKRVLRRGDGVVSMRDYRQHERLFAANGNGRLTLPAPPRPEPDADACRPELEACFAAFIRESAWQCAVHTRLCGEPPESQTQYSYTGMVC
jgi:hypothetical protein